MRFAASPFYDWQLKVGQCIDAITRVLAADDVDQEDAVFVASKVLGARRYFDADDLVATLKMV